MFDTRRPPDHWMRVRLPGPGGLHPRRYAGAGRDVHGVPPLLPRRTDGPVREQAAAQEPAAGHGREPVASEPRHPAPRAEDSVSWPVPEPHLVRLPVRRPPGGRGRREEAAGGQHSSLSGRRVLRLRQTERHSGKYLLSFFLSRHYSKTQLSLTDIICPSTLEMLLQNNSVCY